MKKKYGLDWPDEISEFQLTLNLWKYHKLPVYNCHNVRDPHELLIKAARMVLAPSDWSISKWTEEHIYDWTHSNFIITWGCASSSKSWDYGLLALLDWYGDPGHTITRVATTTRPALLQRAFASIIHYHRLLRAKGIQVPGHLSKVQTAILLDEEDSSTASTKAGIHGIAIRDGPIAESIAYIRGSHAKCVNLIADELSQLPPAIVDPALLTNLRIGADIFRLVGLTNIDSFDDLAGRNSVPVNGWKSVDINTERWETTRGIVRRHDGLRSPAIVEPDGAKKYPYLLTQATLDEIVKAEGGNMHSPAIYSMVRAWPPPQGTDPVVVTEAESIRWGMRTLDSMTGMPEEMQWREHPTAIAGLDPGYGGDRCILQIAKVGYVVDGSLVIAFEDPIQIPINADSTNPILYQIVEFGMDKLQNANVSPDHLAIDDSGPQSVADAFAKAFGPNLLRITFGGRPTELSVSVYNSATGREWYADRTTEMAYTIREYAQYKQIRRFPEEALRELTRRRVLPKRPRRLESKTEFKKNTGLRSPDHMDACGLACAVARECLGLAPGASVYQPHGVASPVGMDPERAAAFNNLEVMDDNYLQRGTGIE